MQKKRSLLAFFCQKVVKYPSGMKPIYSFHHFYTCDFFSHSAVYGQGWCAIPKTVTFISKDKFVLLRKIFSLAACIQSESVLFWFCYNLPFWTKDQLLASVSDGNGLWQKPYFFYYLYFYSSVRCWFCILVSEQKLHVRLKWLSWDMTVCSKLWESEWAAFIVTTSKEECAQRFGHSFTGPDTFPRQASVISFHTILVVLQIHPFWANERVEWAPWTSVTSGLTWSWAGWEEVSVVCLHALCIVYFMHDEW